MAVNKRLRIVYTGGAQLRAAYDGSNYSDFTTNSAGDLTIAPSGGDTTVTGSLAVSSFLTLSSYVDQTRASAGGISFQSKATGDAAQRYTQTIAGTQQWGNGTSAPDVTLARAGVGLLQLTGRLLIGTSDAGSATASGIRAIGLSQFDAGVFINGGSIAAGTIVKSAVTGTAISGATGSSFDLWFGTPGGSAIMAVPTGTQDVQFLGGVRFGTHTTIGAETVTGYITITDKGGTTRKLAVVS